MLWYKLYSAHSRTPARSWHDKPQKDRLNLISDHYESAAVANKRTEHARRGVHAPPSAPGARPWGAGESNWQLFNL